MCMHTVCVMVLQIMTVPCESDQSEALQKIPQLNYTMEYITTYLQEIPQRIRWGSWRE